MAEVFFMCRSCIYLTGPVWMRTMFKLIFRVRIASRWLVAYVRLRPAFSLTRFSVQSEGYYFLRFLWFEINFSPLPFQFYCLVGLACQVFIFLLIPLKIGHKKTVAKNYGYLCKNRKPQGTFYLMVQYSYFFGASTPIAVITPPAFCAPKISIFANPALNSCSSSDVNEMSFAPIFSFK